MATILVVDDHLPTRELLRALLQYKGHRVVLAENGPAALAAAAQESPQLILADVVMPGMDGFALVRLLRERLPGAGAAAIFMSASLDEAAARGQARACGAHAYLVKPFEPAQIFGAVESALAASRSH